MKRLVIILIFVSIALCQQDHVNELVGRSISTRNIGMGMVASYSSDPATMYSNPSNIGIFSLNNNFGASYAGGMWKPEMDMDSKMGQYSVAVGTRLSQIAPPPPKKDSTDTEMSLEDMLDIGFGISYSHQDLELGGKAPTYPGGMGIWDYTSEDKIDAISFGGGINMMMLQIAFGMTMRNVSTTVYGGIIDNGRQLDGSSDFTTRDFGFSFRVPAIAFVRNLTGSTPMEPIKKKKLNIDGEITFGFSHFIKNIGSPEIDFTNTDNTFELERYSGQNMDILLELSSNEINMLDFELSWNPDGGDYEIDDDYSFYAKNAIGYELAIFRTMYFRMGTFEIQPTQEDEYWYYDNQVYSRSYGFSTKMIQEIIRRRRLAAGKPGLDKFLQSFYLTYDWTELYEDDEYEEDEIDGTTFWSINLNYDF